jgi:ribosomal protein S18 acetylase RimI-like enzyme
MVGHVQDGWASFAFVPEGWTPPPLEAQRAQVRERIADPETWAMIAVTPERSVGHISFIPGHERSAGDTASDWAQRPPVPGLAHLWQLFVIREWHGSGVGDRLHAAALEEMRARGFTAARLYTPTDNARARRFYERRGWRAAGGEYHQGLELSMTEYRLDLAQ